MSINILDLPDEILCVIRNQMRMVDVFCSLVGVSQRLDRIALDPLYIDRVDLTIHRATADHSSHDNDRLLERICSNILPRINGNVTKLTLEPLSVQRVLAERDYPTLQCLSFVHFVPVTLARCLAEKSLQRLIANQITCVTVDMNVDNEESAGEGPTNVFVASLLIGERLTDFAYSYTHPQGFLHLLSTNISWPDQLSASLTKLTIKVQTFDDCLHLLNGCLPSLSTFIVRVCNIKRTRAASADAVQAVKLRYFSLTVDCYTFEYERRVVPLLQRMAHLETLVLYLSIGRISCPYVDGDQLDSQILHFMPRLRHLMFSLHTQVYRGWIPRHMILPSTEQFRQSFLRRGLHSVDACSDETFHFDEANGHVYSVPYLFEQFFFLNNSFRSGQFDRVRILSMHDVRPFEHSFFEIVARDFPCVQQLCLLNDKPQQNRCAPRLAAVTFHHLSSLKIFFVHDDYVAQFLSADRAHLPRLSHLTIHYQGLTQLTSHFSDDPKRFNCKTIESLVTHKALVHSERFYLYFPFL